MDQIEEENKDLFEYKIIDSVNVVTIILKYTDMAMPDLIHSSAPTERPRGAAGFQYRSPCQVNRDHWRMNNHHNNRRRWSTNDSGVFTPGKGASSNTGWQDQLESGFFTSNSNFGQRNTINCGTTTMKEMYDGDRITVNSDTCHVEGDAGLSSSHNQPMDHKLIECETQCDLYEELQEHDEVECLVAEFGVQCGVPQPTFIDMGIQCEDTPHKQDFESIGVQCGSSKSEKRDKATACSNTMGTKSKMSQTDKIATSNVSISCIPITKDNHAQTLTNPVKAKVVVVGGQTYRDTVSRHMDADQQTRDTYTQTSLIKENIEDVSCDNQACDLGLGEQSSFRDFMDHVATSAVGHGEYYTRINDEERNRRACHILCTSEHGSKEKVIVLFDDIALIYLTETKQSKYYKYYGISLQKLRAIVENTETYSLPQTDIKYQQYKGHAESNIGAMLSKIREHHPG